MNSCTVIVVNYNTGQLLPQVIDQVLESENISEIIVVDNKSTDNSMELVPNNPKIKKHLLQQNRGFAYGCNYGAKLSQSKYLLFLNPDCLIEKNSITLSLKTLETNKNAGIVGALVNNPDGTEQQATRRRLPTLLRAIKTFSKIEKMAKYCACFAGVNLNHTALPNGTHETQQVEAISGAYIMIKASVFNEIKGFDEDFFLHFEDLDLFKRTLDAGYEILFNANIQVVHHQGTSSRSNPKVKQLKKQSLVKYFKKHHSIFTFSIVWLMSKLLKN